MWKVLVASSRKPRVLRTPASCRDVEQPLPEDREVKIRDTSGVQAMGQRLHCRRPCCNGRCSGGVAVPPGCGIEAASKGRQHFRAGAAGCGSGAGAQRPLGTPGLRRASARSDESYVLELAKLTAMPATPRMQPPGRPVGFPPRCLRIGPTDLPAPPRGIWGCSLKVLLSIAAHWGPGWPAG